MGCVTQLVWLNPPDRFNRDFSKGFTLVILFTGNTVYWNLKTIKCIFRLDCLVKIHVNPMCSITGFLWNRKVPLSDLKTKFVTNQLWKQYLTLSKHSFSKVQVVEKKFRILYWPWLTTFGFDIPILTRFQFSDNIAYHVLDKNLLFQIDPWFRQVCQGVVVKWDFAKIEQKSKAFRKFCDTIISKIEFYQIHQLTKSIYNIKYKNDWLIMEFKGGNSQLGLLKRLKVWEFEL